MHGEFLSTYSKTTITSYEKEILYFSCKLECLEYVEINVNSRNLGRTIDKCDEIIQNFRFFVNSIESINYNES